jgi:hypothetical protein
MLYIIRYICFIFKTSTSEEIGNSKIVLLVKCQKIEEWHITLYSMFYVLFGMIVKVRNRLHDKSVSMLVYCYMNMRLMRKMMEELEYEL